MNKLIAIASISFLILSCNNSKNKELELRERELELKEKQLNIEISKLKRVDSLSSKTIQIINKKSDNTEIDKVPEKIDPAVSNINNLLGYWVDIDNDEIAMYFDRDGSFAFRDLNSSKGSYEEITGTYKLSNGKLTLAYDDRAQQTFNFKREISSLPIFYIQKGRYIMVKATVQE